MRGVKYLTWDRFVLPYLNSRLTVSANLSYLAEGSDTCRGISSSTRFSPHHISTCKACVQRFTWRTSGYRRSRKASGQCRWCGQDRALTILCGSGRLLQGQFSNPHRFQAPMIPCMISAERRIRAILQELAAVSRLRGYRERIESGAANPACP